MGETRVLVFLLGCYGCIFHGAGNSAQLCQNFGISGGGGSFEWIPPSVRHWSSLLLWLFRPYIRDTSGAFSLYFASFEAKDWKYTSNGYAVIFCLSLLLPRLEDCLNVLYEIFSSGILLIFSDTNSIRIFVKFLKYFSVVKDLHLGTFRTVMISGVILYFPSKKGKWTKAQYHPTHNFSWGNNYFCTLFDF
jgi:hypothetical protein